MNFNTHQLTAVLVAVSFAAGLNVYATLLSLGILARVGALALPPGLDLLEQWYTLAICGALFVIEFFGDKIPAFDLIWNALHTFVRVPIAALLAYRATMNLSPGEQLIAALAGGAIALAAHGGKMAVRASVTASPEPFSNFALSATEDAFAVFLTWLATQHPYLSASIAGALLIVLIILVRWVVRALRSLFRQTFAAVTTER